MDGGASGPVESARMMRPPTALVLLVPALAALGGCLSAERPMAAPDGQGEVPCGAEAPCPAVDDPCAEAFCDAGVCAQRARAEGSECDDGDPCTGAGRCSRAGACAGAPTLEEGASCSNGRACDGEERCQAGACVPGAPVQCPASGVSCVTVACDEARGGCVERPVSDGTLCGSGEGGAEVRGECQAGGCVPPGMRFVAAGAFTMGCGDTFCAADAQPAHAVWLDAYAIDAHEITGADYQRCLEDADGQGWACPRYGTGASLLGSTPEGAAVRLTWESAAKVCAYLGKRLCTEAEWEKAARGSDLRTYPWGDAPEPNCDRAVMREAGVGACGLGHPAAPGTRPLGASPYGVLDLAGNALEWVADFYNPDAYAARAAAGEVRNPVQDAPVVAHPLSRVTRGGGWRDALGLELRADRRHAHLFSDFGDDTGARCCAAPLASPVGGGAP